MRYYNLKSLNMAQYYNYSDEVINEIARIAREQGLKYGEFLKKALRRTYSGSESRSAYTNRKH
jgi:hypothetical protein